MLKLTLLAAFSFLTAACSNHSTNTEFGKQGVQDASDSRGKSSTTVNPLKTSTSGQQAQFNELQLVNIHPQVIARDYSFNSTRNVSLALGLLKNGPFIGCQESNLAFEFRLYKAGRDGHAIESLGYSGLGFTPTPVEAGQMYIVRYLLNVEKDCLGLVSKFTFVEGIIRQ